MAASMRRSKDPYEMGFLIAPRVPQGLAAVVENLTREVLRQRPEDIYVFAARHFEKLLTLRERYDVEKTNGSEYHFYNTVGKRKEYKESRKRRSSTKDISSGWSLNETAKVLERHRNIFGDGEKRISTEEVRALAKEKNERSSSGTKHKREKRSSNDTQEYSKDSTRTTGENNDSSRLDRSAKTLKIISQIPTVLTRNSGTKDIKMELRKNRLSGSLREKSTDSSNEGQLPERPGDVSRKSLGKAERAEVVQKFEEERISKKSVGRSGSVERNSGQSSRTRRRKGSFSELMDRNELPRTGNMDQVREYVVRNFGSAKNIDELDLDYVGRVQDAIDRNMPMIKDKIEDLKNDAVYQTSKRRESNIDIDNRSTSTVERPRRRGSRPNTSESDGRRSIEKQESYRSKRSSSVDSTASRRQQDDTLEARLMDTQNILEDISSKCYPKSQSVRPRSSNGQSNEQENGSSSSDGDSKITLPAVRPSSSRSSRSLSRNESDNLILPPISPDTGKIPKKKNDATLPTLSSAGVETSSSSSSLQAEEKENNSMGDNNLGKEILQLSTSIKEDISSTRKMLEDVNDAFKMSTTSDDKNQVDEETSSTKDTTNVKEEELIQVTIEKPDDILDQNVIEITQVEEVFKDSLNVTPDIIDIPQRPDSLEPHVEDERPTTADSHLSTVDETVELKQKLMEIQEMERNVGKAISSFEESINREDIKDSESVLVVTEDNTVTGTEDAIVVESKESVKEDETIKEAPDRPEKESQTNMNKSMDDTNESSDRSKNKSEMESDDANILQGVIVDNEVKNNIEMSKSETEKEDNNKTLETSNEQEVEKTQEDSPLSLKAKEEKNPLHISLPATPKEVPYSYILTEGSPVEIPEFVTTVIIPDRPPSSPELDAESNEDVELREERRKRAVESFGEYIRPEPIECSTVDIDFIRGIKAGHDIAIVRQDLDHIKEEEEGDEEKRSKVNDEISKIEIKKDHTPVLEHISENEEIEENDESNKSERKIVSIEREDIAVKEIAIESESPTDNQEITPENANVVEISLEGEESTETPDVTSDSTNEVKETTITDRSTDSLSLDPTRPIVPELNLDSLRDITISSFKMNDADGTVSLTEPMSSEKEKEDVERNTETRQEENIDENTDTGRKEDTSAMETISMDDKRVEVEPLLTDLEIEEIKKEEVIDPSKETIENEEERSVTSNEANTKQPENVEQRDTIKSATSSPRYLGLEENAADLDTEEEIAKELIEIDRAENSLMPQESQIVVEDRSRKLSRETLDNSGTTEERGEALTIVETRQEEKKLDGDATSPKIESSTISVETLQETESAKDNEEIISGVVESGRSSGNEEGKDQSNGSPEDNERSETSVMALEQEEVKKFNSDAKLGEEKEYHVYVTDLKPIESEEDDTKSSSNTFHSAATKIQAGVRGFLTRRRLRGSNYQDSTLDNVPSIKESFADESLATDIKSEETVVDSPVEATDTSTTRPEKVTTAEEKENIPLAQTISMPAKSRQCLRREDAMQRNTLSTENAFASSGVQHTGEFHDCLPLPVLESIEIPRHATLSQNEDRDKDSEEKSIDRQTETPKEKSLVDSPTNLTPESKERTGYETIENIDQTPGDFVQDLNNLLGGLHPKDFAKLLTGQANTPIMVELIDIAPNPVLGTNSNVIFETNANLNADDDPTRPAKDESTLQNRYLNFITSVEDNEPSHVKDTIEEYKDHSNDHSIQSLREPLALPGTPEGIVIEELSSLDSTILSKLQDASFNPTSLESAMMDRESIDKSVMDSEKSREFSEESNDDDVQILTTSTGEETEIDNKPAVVNESLMISSAKTETIETPASVSDDSNEDTKTSKSPKEDNVEHDDALVETKEDRLSDDDKDSKKNEEVIEQSMVKSPSSETKETSSDQNVEPSLETKDSDKDNNTNEEAIEPSTVKSLPSETKEIDNDQNTESGLEVKGDANEERIEQSTIKSLSTENEEVSNDQSAECSSEAKEEVKDDQLSEDDKNNNKNAEEIERSSVKSLSSETEEVVTSQNAETKKEEIKDDQVSEDNKDNDKNNETTERSTIKSSSSDSKDVDGNQNTEFKEEIKTDRSSDNDKDDNNEETIERSTITSLQSEIKDIDSDKNTKSSSETKEVNEDEEDKAKKTTPDDSTKRSADETV